MSRAVRFQGILRGLVRVRALAAGAHALGYDIEAALDGPHGD
jgi:hypothetical protein